MFNNVAGISVVECTMVCKIHDAIQLLSEPKTKRSDNQEKNVGLCHTENTAAKMCKQKHLTEHCSPAVNMDKICQQPTYKQHSASKKCLYAHQYLLITGDTLKKGKPLFAIILQAHMYRVHPTALSQS